jgi:hypothetical protein
MCLEAIWGGNQLTLNCVAYDHNWVKQYVYEDDAAPLLPKGKIVHLIGFLDTTPANKNPADPRNWAGGGRRSVANMFIDLGYSVSLTEEQFQAEMAKRRAKMKLTRSSVMIGCPLCNMDIPARCLPPRPAAATAVIRARRQPLSGAGTMKYAIFVGMCLLLSGASAAAQSLTYSRGQNVSPAYEGWEEDADGKRYFVFGYMNRNWEEEIDVPAGPDNGFSAGGADQGQPTHFLPRRNRFVFRVPVPAGFTEKDEPA